MIYLQNVMEKPIYDKFLLFLCKRLKLICSYKCIKSYFPATTSVFNCVVSHIIKQEHMNIS